MSERGGGTANPIRAPGVDVMKVALAFMVVGIHGHFLRDFSPLLSHVLVDGLFRVAVPVFLLINGFYFQSLIDVVGIIRWFRRVVVLYLVWMAVYAFAWIAPATVDGVGSASLIKVVIFGYHHLWYLPATLCAAAMLLFFRNWVPRSLIVALAIALYSLGVLFQYLGLADFFAHPLDNIVDRVWVRRNFIFIGFPFFAIGYLLAETRCWLHIKLACVLCALGFGLILLIFESVASYLLFDAAPLDNLMTVLFICPFLFMAALRVRLDVEGKLWSRYASGIYFSHVMFFLLAASAVKFGETVVTLMVLVAAVLSTYFIIKINRRLPYIL